MHQTVTSQAVPNVSKNSLAGAVVATLDLRLCVICPDQTRESLSWIRMTRTARQDARRLGKEDAGHSLFLGGCLFGFYGEHNSKYSKGSCRDVT